MQPLEPQTLIALLVTAAAGISMTRVGLHKGLLARRVRAERCASCGNRLRGNGCANCRRR
jgi:hypothetical protein